MTRLRLETNEERDARQRQAFEVIKLGARQRSRITLEPGQYLVENERAGATQEVIMVRYRSEIDVEQEFHYERPDIKHGKIGWHIRRHFLDTLAVVPRRVRDVPAPTAVPGPGTPADAPTRRRWWARVRAWFRGRPRLPKATVVS